MATDKCFEKLRIWQDARMLVKEVYSNTSSIRDYGFNDQIQRAAVSIMNNIAEGYESHTDLMFKKFLVIAKGSCGEVRSMLYIAEDLKYIKSDITGALTTKCQILSGGISKLITYLDRNKRMSLSSFVLCHLSCVILKKKNHG